MCMCIPAEQTAGNSRTAAAAEKATSQHLYKTLLLLPRLLLLSSHAVIQRTCLQSCAAAGRAVAQVHGSNLIGYPALPCCTAYL
jgi:hypothetical protein